MSIDKIALNSAKQLTDSMQKPLQNLQDCTSSAIVDTIDSFENFQIGMSNFGKAQINLKKNLLHQFKNNIFRVREIDEMLEGISDNERFLGSLPFEWIKDIPKDERGIKTLEIETIFSNLARKFSDAYILVDERRIAKAKELGYPNYAKAIKDFEVYCQISASIGKDNKKIITSAKEEFIEKLKKIFGENVRLEYIKHGEVGQVYKLSINDKDYALKLFTKQLKDGGRISRYTHGKTCEIANAIAYNHGKKPSKCSKFYFGKIAKKEDYDGFILSEFVNGEPCEIKKPTGLHFERFDLHDDNSKNRLNGKVIDYGSIFRRYGNKKHEQIAKEIIAATNSNNTELLEKIKQKYSNTKDLNEILSRINGNDLYSL